MLKVLKEKFKEPEQRSQNLNQLLRFFSCAAMKVATKPSLMKVHIGNMLIPTGREYACSFPGCGKVTHVLLFIVIVFKPYSYCA